MKAILIILFAVNVNVVCAAQDIKQTDGNSPQVLFSNPFIRAKFVQQRSLKVLRHPLVTKGLFLHLPEKGFIWQTNEPYKSTLLVSADSIRILNGDGNILNSGGQNKSAVMDFYKAFSAVLSGDQKKLNNLFVIVEHVSEDGLQRVKLQLNESFAADIIQNIIVKGRNSVEYIHIVEKNGDATEIKFFAKIRNIDNLTSAERSLLDMLQQ